MLLTRAGGSRSGKTHEGSRHGKAEIDRRPALPHSARRAGIRFHAWRDDVVRAASPRGSPTPTAQEGVGYTYTTGHNGGAIHHILAREIPELVAGADCELIEAAVAEGLVGAALWRPRRPDRARAVGARHGAVGPQGAAGKLPLYRLLGGHDARVPCYAGGIDLDLSVKDLLAQTDGNLAKGFRAIKTKVGRDAAARRMSSASGAMRRHLGDGFPLMVDANMKWSADEAIRARAGAARLRPRCGSRSRPSPTMSPATPASLREGGLPVATGENFRTLWEFQQMISAGGVTYPGAGRHQLRRRHGVHEGRAPRRGVQPAGHLARRARRDGASARRLPQPQLPRNARLRHQQLHRRSACASRTARRSRPSGPAMASPSTGRGSTASAPKAPAARSRRTPARAAARTGSAWGPRDRAR